MAGSARAVVFDTYWDVSALLWDSGNTAPSKTVHLVGGSGVEFDVTIATDAGNLLTGPYKPGGVSYLSDTGGVDGSDWFAGILTFTASNFTFTGAPPEKVTFQLVDTSGRQLTSSVIVFASTATPTTNIPTGLGFGDKAFTNLGLDSSAGSLSGGQYQATITWQVSGNGEDYGLWREFTFKVSMLPATAAYWDLNGTGTGAGGPAPAGTWNAGNTNWNALADGTGSTAAWTSALRAVFAAGTDATGTYTVVVDGTRDIGDLKFQQGTVTLAPGPAGALRLTGVGDAEVAAGLTATISTPISEDVAGRGLHKTGPGTLVLSGAGSYTGKTTVQDGTLRLGADNVLPDASAVTVSGNAAAVTGTLDLAGHSDTIGSLTLGGATPSSAAAVTTGAGTLTLGGDVTYGNTYSPSVCLGATISGKLDLGSASRTFTVNDSPAAADDLTVSADISGAGVGLTKAGAGTLVLSGANTYTGTTTISGGMVSVAAAHNLGGATPLVFDGGALRVTGTALTDFGTHTPTFNAGKTVTLDIADAGNTFTVSQVLNQATGGLTKLGAGALVVPNASNSYTGATTVSAGTLVVGANAPSGSNGAMGNAISEVPLGVAGGNSNAGILIGGPYTVGRIIRTPTNNNSDAGTRVLTLGGTTADESTFSGNIILGTANQAGRLVTLTAAAGGQVTFSGVIQGPDGSPSAAEAAMAAVTKAGPGTVVLSNSSTYTGATVVNEGTLLVNGSLASAVTVNAGGTLGGIGLIGAVTVNADGAVAPGGSVGTLKATGNVAMGEGSIYEWQLAAKTGSAGTSWDLITAASINLTGLITFKVDSSLFSGWISATDSFIVASTTTGTITNAATYHFILPDGWTDGSLNLSGDGKSLILSGLSSSIPGDANGDKVVDAADFITLKKNFGGGAGAGPEVGNFDETGTVDWADLGILMDNMGPGGGAPSTAPEPCSAILLVFGAAALLRRRRKA
jgi:autotransporter-associated beta strand protein